MGSGIYALTDELLTQVSVPVVLYLIVRTPRNPPGYQRPSIAQEAMEAEDEIFFIGGDLAALDGRAEVVHPPEAAALAAAEESGALWEGSPAALAFFLDVIG